VDTLGRNGNRNEKAEPETGSASGERERERERAARYPVYEVDAMELDRG
jgi:hypothetical protein